MNPLLNGVVYKIYYNKLGYIGTDINTETRVFS